MVRKWLTGQKEGQVVPKVVNREPILGVLFSPPSEDSERLSRPGWREMVDKGMVQW